MLTYSLMSATRAYLKVLEVVFRSCRAVEIDVGLARWGNSVTLLIADSSQNLDISVIGLRSAVQY